MSESAHPEPTAQRGAITPDQERTWGMMAHLIPLIAMVVSAGFLGFVGSLVVFLVYRDRGPFVRSHAANSLNIQIWTFLGLVISVPLMLILVGFVTFGIVLIWAFVVHIIGAVKANRGEWYTPSLVPRFVR